MRLGNKSTRFEQRGKVLKNVAFFKRNKVKLIRHNMLRRNSLRISIIPPQRAIENFHCPGYVIRLQKNNKNKQREENLQEKFARKRCPSQLNIKVFTKTKIFLSATFFSNDQRTANYCITVERNQKPNNTGEYAKIMINLWKLLVPRTKTI